MKEIPVAVADANLRGELLRVLGEQGAHCRGVEYASKTLELIEGGNTDLLILDLHLPDQNGDEVLKDIRKNYSRLPVLMLVAKKDPWFINRCTQAGAQKVLSYEEISSPVFLETVRDLLHIEHRIELKIPVQYYIVESKTKEIFTGKSVDMSMAGILLISPRTAVETGILVDIRLGLDPPLLARGEVVRIVETKEGYRIAIRWVLFRRGDRQRLRAIIYGERNQAEQT